MIENIVNHVKWLDAIGMFWGVVVMLLEVFVLIIFVAILCEWVPRFMHRALWPIKGNKWLNKPVVVDKNGFTLVDGIPGWNCHEGCVYGIKDIETKLPIRIVGGDGSMFIWLNKDQYCRIVWIDGSLGIIRTKYSCVDILPKVDGYRLTNRQHLRITPAKKETKNV